MAKKTKYVILGETDPESGDIHINLSTLYNTSPDEDVFIKRFGEVLVHEQYTER